MKNESESPKETVNRGFTRGIAGKEQDASTAHRVSSSEPLPDELLNYRKIYIIAIILLIIPPFGIFALMIACIINDMATNYKRLNLRTMKFKFKNDVNNDMLFETMQPVLVKKYGMQIEKNDKGITITHKDYIYDIIINEDSTFTIWWRMGLGSAFIPKSKYKSYKIILADMGIIAFEIQESLEIA